MKEAKLKGMDVVRVAQWLIATVAISFSTCFAVVHFAYSDFDTQRTNDIYREQINKRLDDMNIELVEINHKIDRILIFKK